MFASALLALAALASVVVADPVPLEPSSTSVFQEGGNCTILWTPDSTGKWTTMYIELMTGDNLSQVHLKTVGTVDGTDSNVHSYSYTCPGVTPHSAIYFYKFTSPGAPNDALFTTRFTITDSTGATTSPTGTETATDGTAVAWGTGALTDPSQGDQPPNLNSNSTDTTGATSAPSATGSTGSNSAQTGSDAIFSTTRTGVSSTAAPTTSSNNAGSHALPSLALGVAGAFAAMLFL